MSTVHYRPITDADLDAVLRLIRHSDAADGVPRNISMEELVDDLTGDHGDMATDSLLATVDDEVVGYVHTLYLPSDVSLERCYLVGLVAPEHRGRGIGSALIDWAMARGTDQLRSSGSTLPKFIRLDNYDFVESFHRLAARKGFTPVRYFEQLLRPLVDLPTFETTLADGITCVRWPDDRSEEIRAVKNAAFADHWGSTPTTELRWRQQLEASYTRLDWSWIALNDRDEVVGYCVNERYESDDEVTGRQEAWIANIGTARDYRGRGVATALMARSLHDFAEAGLSHAILGVDSDSPTGAPNVYRNLGFEPYSKTVTLQIELKD